MKKKTKKAATASHTTQETEMINLNELTAFEPQTNFFDDVETIEVETVKVEALDVEFKSVSAQIRFLFDSGMKQSAIAKQLGVRDQYVSNVVRAYKAKKLIKE